jgi:hypothetical protein
MNRLLLFLLVLFAACQNEGREPTQNTEPPDLNAELPGTWEAVSLRVKVNSANGQDSSYVFEVKEEQWVRRYGVQPVKTVYQPDNKYRQEYYGINDSLINQARGIWNVFGDTLMMIAPNETSQYIVSIGEGRSEFRALVDWDEDGVADDEYLRVNRLVSLDVE